MNFLSRFIIFYFGDVSKPLVSDVLNLLIFMNFCQERCRFKILRRTAR